MRQQQDEPGRFSICSRQAAVVLLYVYFPSPPGNLANTFLLFLPPAPSEYRDEEMCGHALPASGKRPLRRTR
ncbi:hypothetical protein AUD63_003699 [Salmonella enterica subsp. enterica serovar Albany]|nr:hypothetical protein [Salmonella enterica subsp. enterica serovar Albany]